MDITKVTQIIPYLSNIGKVTLLTIYVGNMVITGDDVKEIGELQKHLALEKDLGHFEAFSRNQSDSLCY